MSHYVRPFGFLGKRYQVSSQGLIYQRLSWAAVFIGGVLLGPSIIVSDPESNARVLIGVGVMLATSFIVLRLTALVIENGTPVSRKD